MDLIDRSLSADELVRASPRFTEHVMAEVRAAARLRSSPVFPWRWFLLRLATGFSLVVAAIRSVMAIDVSSLAPVAAYLIAAGAILIALLAAMRLPEFHPGGG